MIFEQIYSTNWSNPISATIQCQSDTDNNGSNKENLCEGQVE